jgi:hypothetical protein
MKSFTSGLSGRVADSLDEAKAAWSGVRYRIKERTKLGLSRQLSYGLTPA